ncbi:MAG: ATP-binding protein [Vicinamibacterales bacterium]
MGCPPAVRRGLRRIVLGTAALALLVLATALPWARSDLGWSVADTRARIQQDVRAQVAALGGVLDASIDALAVDGRAIEAAAGGATDAVRLLFDRVGAVQRQASPLAALTVYDGDGVPLAWVGRPATLPAARLAGAAATFLVPTPLGLRLARLEPVAGADGGRRRVGVVVAEAALSSATGPTQPAAAVEIDSRLAPVLLGPSTGGPADPAAVDLVAQDGSVLGTARVEPAGIQVARDRWWGRVRAAVWLLLAAGLLLAVGPLADWRAATRLTTSYLGVTVLAVGTLSASWWATQRALGAGRFAAASELAFLATALLAAGVVWLAWNTVGRWRVARRRTAPRGAAWGAVVVHVVIGAAAGAAVAYYDVLVARVLPLASAEAVRVALTPLTTGRLAAAAGTIVLHAASAGAWLVVFAAAAAVWPMGGGRSGRSRRIAALAVGMTAGVTVWHPAGWSVWPVATAVAALLGMAAAAPRAREVLRRGTQPARLGVLLAALLLPSLALYPALSGLAARDRHDAVERLIAAQVVDQRLDLQRSLRDALDEIDRMEGMSDLVAASTPPSSGPVAVDAAFHVWSQTTLAARRLTSSVELYDATGRMVNRFALNLPETAADQAWQESSCDWELFEEVSPFFAEERRLLHAGRRVCVDDGRGRRAVGSVVVHVVLDYSNLPFLAAQNPYVGLLRATAANGSPAPRDDVAFAVYGWSRRPLFAAGTEPWPLSDALFTRLTASREPFWAVVEDRGVASDVYLLSDRAAIYAIGHPRVSLLGHLAALAELVTLAAMVFAALVVAATAASWAGGRVPVSGRALLRQVRASFSRTLFVAFVAAVVVPVVALALVTRAYMATSLRADIEREATRTAVSASRVVEDFASIEARGATNLPVLDDSLLVWLSRVIGEDINVFAGTGLLASSERNLFTSGLLPTRTPGDVYRALALDGRATYLATEAVGDYQYYVASAPVRLDDRLAIVSVPLTLRQRGIERQLDELDRRVLLAAIAFILFGSAIGYWAAQRISDPVNRLTRATQRLAAGDLDARVLVTSADELGRLVEAFNGMADDLQRQRARLERTNRLEAWAEMARQVAHDIKNPLTPIQLNAEHLRRVHADRGRPLGPVVDECIGHVLLQVRLLRQLAAEFSSFASSPQARPEPTALAPLVDELLQPYVTALAGRIAIAVDVPADLPLVAVDRVLLSRALTNVIENGLHAMSARGTLTVDAAAAGAGVELRIADSGVGMDAAALARIFEPYFSTKATGTGLGLTIARRNIELNGGTIAVTSTPGVGTTVTMQLPAA